MYHGPKTIKALITHDQMKWVLHRVSMYDICVGFGSNLTWFATSELEKQ